MSETPVTLETYLKELIGQVVEEKIRALRSELNGQEDRLLDAEEASKLLGMSRYWLYRHAQRLPFTRKLGPKNLRFSYQGIQKYLATRKIS